MKLQSIEWLRNEMKDVTDYVCRCGKIFESFDDWWNHNIISKHIIMTEEDIEGLKEFVAKLE